MEAVSQTAVLTKPGNGQAIGLHSLRAEAIRVGRPGHPSYGLLRLYSELDGPLGW